MFRFVGLAVLVTGCIQGGALGDDDEAVGSAAAGSASAEFVGLYPLPSATASRADGDVTALALAADGTYVRARCYHADCGLVVPQADHYDVFTSSSGKTYLRFMSVALDHDARADLVPDPVVADVYEIRTTSGGVALRKTYTSRWTEIAVATAAQACQATGGAWSGSACACASADQEFVAGAGGCIATPGASEAACDASDGLWTDDDANAVGAYCVCGLDRYLDATGRCEAL